MGHIVVETRIAAPREIVFDLARDVGAHNRTAAFTRERAVPPGRLEGLLNLDDQVTFEGRHFGFRQRFTAKIVEMKRPERFADELVRATFRSLRHVHDFDLLPDGTTLMRDTLDWVSPLGWLGRVADGLVIERHLRRFLERKQNALRDVAEGMAKGQQVP